ncbi:FtsW/RodA/SpoVE family cell cycle protein [Furfurilactobacillus curtus]|uniref:Cell division protein FtsW n=1 Tax=Furfurilactobacillus curtus TaxID=1746200 RepID=A0ABQ5JPU7_9LACO
MKPKYMIHSVSNEQVGNYGWGIVLCLLLLFVVSMATLYVACLHDLRPISVSKTLLMQGVWYVLGASVAAIVMRLSETQLTRWAPLGYFCGLALLVLVLFFYSRAYFVQTGAKSWFAFGPVTFQPAEVMKPVFILMMARLLVKDHHNGPHLSSADDWHLLGVMVLYTLPVIVMLKLINDFGTTMVFMAMFVGFLIISQCRPKFLWRLGLIGGTIGALLLWAATSNRGQQLLSYVGFQPYQFARINAWLNPSGDQANQSYQLWQSIKAIGSGGVWGSGVHHLVYVPVRESDMIFSVVGEVTGFIGGLGLLMIFMYLFYLIIRSALVSKRLFYVYVATGVVSMLLFHTFENIGMTIGLLPLTGIPLPFISQGGSALIGNFIGIGLVLSTQYPDVRSIFATPGKFR